MLATLQSGRSAVRLVHGRLSWRAVPNPTAYEVWRNGKHVATTTATNFRAAHGRCRIRALNPLGTGPFG
jgi:hypothetical protein